MSEWIQVTTIEVLQEGQMQPAMVGDREIVLALLEGEVHAFAALCPHASGELAEGDLRSDYVICPIHAYRFDLRSGRCLKPRDGPRLRIYEVAIRGTMVLVKL